MVPIDSAIGNIISPSVHIGEKGLRVADPTEYEYGLRRQLNVGGGLNLGGRQSSITN
jgi:hypothetical protein